MDVLLIQSGNGAENPDLRAKNQRMEIMIQPPIGLTTIGTCLQEEGYKVKGIDLYLIDTFDDLKIELLKSPPLIGIGFCTEKYESTRKIIEVCRKLSPQSIIVLGGPHVSFLPEETLRDLKADAAVVFDGEIPMLNLIRAIYQKDSLDNIAGVKTLNNGMVVPQYVKDLDSLPIPERRIFNYEKYKKTNEVAAPGKEHMTGLPFNRGCPHNCHYCVAPAIRKHVPVRKRSVDNFIKEVHFLKDEYNLSCFQIVDELFTQNEKTLLEVCSRFKSFGNITWGCEARVDRLSYDLMAQMQEAGCISLQIGIECANNNSLREIGKSTTVEQIINVARWQKELGNLFVFGVMMFGLPSDTKDILKQKMELTLKLYEYGVYVMFSILTPYPGTEIYNNPEKYGIKINSFDWSRYDFYDCVIQTRHLSTEEILAAAEEFKKIFPRYKQRMLSLGKLPPFFR